LLVIKSGIENKREIAKKLYRNMIGTGAGVDFIVETPEILEEYKNAIGLVYKYALQEGKVVYGS
jgi:uncharacterized protein